MGADGLGGRRAILRQQGVGDAVGKGPVRFVVQVDELERQAPRELAHHRARAAVAAIGHDLERPQARDVHRGHHVVGVPGQDVVQFQTAGTTGYRQPARSGEPADLVEPRIAADRARALPHQLHPVVVDGIVARGDHDAAGEAARGGRPVDHLGAAEPEVEDVGPAEAQPLGHRGRQLVAAETAIPAQADLAAAEVRRHGLADAQREIRVQILRHAAADVISLETPGFDVVHARPFVVVRNIVADFRPIGHHSPSSDHPTCPRRRPCVDPCSSFWSPDSACWPAA